MCKITGRYAKSQLYGQNKKINRYNNKKNNANCYKTLRQITNARKAAAKNIRLEKNIRIIYYIKCIDNDKNTKIVTPSIKGY